MIIDEREERAVEEGEEVEADRSRVIARRGFVSFETRKILKLEPRAHFKKKTMAVRRDIP